MNGTRARSLNNEHIYFVQKKRQRQSILHTQQEKSNSKGKQEL